MAEGVIEVIVVTAIVVVLLAVVVVVVVLKVVVVEVGLVVQVHVDDTADNVDVLEAGCCSVSPTPSSRRRCSRRRGRRSSMIARSMDEYTNQGVKRLQTLFFQLDHELPYLWRERIVFPSLLPKHVVLL